MTDQAQPNEIGIFIAEDGSYRILVPDAWAAKNQLPELAFLSVACVLRLAHPAEVEFKKGIERWAETNLRKQSGDQVKLIPPKAPRKPN